jgi:hypothetical protein
MGNLLADESGLNLGSDNDSVNSPLGSGYASRFWQQQHFETRPLGSGPVILSQWYRDAHSIGGFTNSTAEL